MITEEKTPLTKLDISANGSRDVEDEFLAFIEEVSYETNVDMRWVEIAKTHIQEGAMAIRKAIFSGSTTLDKRDKTKKTWLDELRDEHTTLEEKRCDLRVYMQCRDFKELSNANKKPFEDKEKSIGALMEIVRDQIAQKEQRDQEE